MAQRYSNSIWKLRDAHINPLGGVEAAATGLSGAPDAEHPILSCVKSRLETLHLSGNQPPGGRLGEARLAWPLPGFL